MSSDVDLSGPTRARAWQVVAYHALSSRRYLRSIVVIGLATPLLYVLALGVGLGTVVDRHAGANHGSGLGGVPYLVFVAPGLLSAATLQIAAGEGAYPVLGGFTWQRVFHGMAATPLSARQICDGLLIWIGIRLTVNAAIYLAIMSCFGAARRWQIVFAVPAAALVGVAFAAPVMAFAATMKPGGSGLNMLFRFVVTPMFLFSGTFYPLSQLPAWGRWLAWVSPLWHGTELARDAAIGGLSTGAVLGHTAYLLLWLGVGVTLARRRFALRVAR